MFCQQAKVYYERLRRYGSHTAMDETTSIEVTLLANEGILIQWNGIKILIDGMHENENEMFSGLSQNILEDLIAGEKPLYRNIDYILFTHCHFDHFSADVTEAFLKEHRVKGFMLPDRQSQEFTSLRDTAKLQADKTWLLDLPLGDKKEIKLSESKGFSLTVFRAIHAGEQYLDVENYCYLLNFNGRKIFIIADSDYDSNYFSKMLPDDTIETAFVNPLFLSIGGGRDVITHALKPEKLVVYHIPFEDKDPAGFRKLTMRNIERYRSSLPPVFVLWNELQTIVFK